MERGPGLRVQSALSHTVTVNTPATVESRSSSDHPDQGADPLRALIERLVLRDERALHELSALAAPRLHAICMRVLRCGEDAEEVVADVLLWLWDHPQRFDPARGQAMAWLARLSWRRAVDLRRSRQRRESLLHPDPDAGAYVQSTSGAGEPQLWQARMESGHRLTRALQQLRGNQRQMILLAFIDGLTQQEIAEQTGRPLGTVKSDIRRGLQALARLLGGHEALEAWS